MSKYLSTFISSSRVLKNSVSSLSVTRDLHCWRNGRTHCTILKTGLSVVPNKCNLQSSLTLKVNLVLIRVSNYNHKALSGQSNLVISLFQ